MRQFRTERSPTKETYPLLGSITNQINYILRLDIDKSGKVHKSLPLFTLEIRSAAHTDTIPIPFLIA